MSKVIARGTVLVDPRKAVEKLRAHQLAQPGLYVLEVVRAATLLGATELTLENDADDLALSWEGVAPPADRLARLLDHLFDANDRALRLLAIAVNAALGLEPSFVDLYTTNHPALAPTQVARVRYTARDGVLGEGEVGAVDRAKSLPRNGFRLHVRERFGAAVIAEWLRREPAETALLRARLLAPRVSVAREGAAVRAPAPETFASVALELGTGVTGAMHLVAAGRGGALSLCELGVLLERRDLESPAFAASRRERFPLATLPLHVVVDADLLETNIARSQVDLDRGIGPLLERQWPAGVEALVAEALARTLALPVDDVARRTGEEALMALVLWEEGARWPEAALRDAPTERPERLPIGRLHASLVAPLFRAPIVPTPFGERVSLRDLAASRGRWASWSDEEPIAHDLAPWLREVVWSPAQRPVLRALLGCVELRNGARALSEAREAMKRWRALMAHPPRPVKVTRGGRAALRVELGDDDALRGELVVVASELTQSAPMLSAAIYFEGRPFCETDLGRAAVAMRVAVQSSLIAPTPDLLGVTQNEGLARVTLALRERFVIAVAQGLASGSLEVSEPALRARLTRAAWLEAYAASPRVDARRDRLRSLLGAYPALAREPAWRTTTDHLVTTLDVLDDAHAAPRVVLHGEPGSGPRFDARAVLALDPSERAFFEALLDEDVRWIDLRAYLPARITAVPGELVAASLKGSRFSWTTAATERARVSVSAIAGSRGTLSVVHSGVVVWTRPRSERLGPSAIVVEDDELIPFPDGSGSLTPAAAALISGAELALASWLCDVFAGDLHPGARFERDDARRFLLVALTRIVDVSGELAALRARVEAVPLVPRWHSEGALREVSVAALREELSRGGGATLHFLASAPSGLVGDGWQPLILPTKEQQELVGKVLGVKLRAGDDVLRRARLARAKQLARAALRANPSERVEDRLHGSSPVVLPEADDAALSYVVRRDRGEGEVRVLLDGVLALRETSLSMPAALAVRVALRDDRGFSDDFKRLSRGGEALVAAQVARASTHAASEVVRRAEDGQAIDEVDRALVCAWLLAQGRKEKDHPDLPTARLAAAPLWCDPSGARRSVREVQTKKGVVRVLLGWSSEWLPPAADEPADPELLSLARQEELDALRVLARRVKDHTAEMKTLQRRRAFVRGDALRVGLPGEPLAPWAAARFTLHGELVARGEVRLTSRASGTEVSVFDDGVVASKLRLDSPIGIDVALASPDLDPARPGDAASLVEVQMEAEERAREMLRACLEAHGEVPSWARRALRWHICTGDEGDALSLPVDAFEDSARAPMSLRDMEIQRERFGVVAYVIGSPAEPVAPREAGRRVVVLARGELGWLSERLPMVDFGESLAEDLAASQWSRLTPAREIRVTAPPARHALREVLRADEHGVEGELLLLLWNAPDGGTAQWFFERRPLGSTPVASPWPAVVALSAELTPRADRRGPVDDALLKRAVAAAEAQVARTLARALGPRPGEALATLSVHEGRSPAMSAGVPQAVGSLWLTADGGAGELDVIVGPAKYRVAAMKPRERVADAAVIAPISGTLWLRAGAGAQRDQWEPLVQRVVAWSWRRLMDQWLSQREVDPSDDLTLTHLLLAGLANELGGASAALARRAKLPGGGVTVSRAVQAVREGHKLSLRKEREGGGKRFVAPTRARWFDVLEASEVFERSAPEARRDEAPRAAAPSPPEPPRAKPEAPAPAPVPATPKAPETREKRLAEALIRSLRARGVDAKALRSVEIRREVPGRDSVGYDPKARSAWLRADAPWVRLALDDPDGAVDVAVMGVLGEVNRALDEVTDAHEEAALRAMLRARAQG